MAGSVIVIGSGFAGLSAASFMAKAGWKVQVLEKNETPGGRARQLREDGFVFDMGPSWYWMPDVFERYFARFGKNVSDYYRLHRLDPSYRVYWEQGHTDLPADYEALKAVFESMEPGSGHRLDRFMAEAAYKYEVGINKLVYKPGQSLREFLDPAVLKGVFRLDVFRSIRSHIARYFKDARLRQLMEFPVLFLGALPQNTPALYSLMNYADIRGGTWYPEGGMYAVVQAMYDLARELGVTFHFGEEAREIVIEQGRARRVLTDRGTYEADAVISGADYHFTEKNLLAPPYRSYSDSYWDRRVMAPSCLMYYVGVRKKLRDVLHHALFFDVPFEPHAREIYSDPRWPSNPLFYVSVNSVTDPTVAPPGHENLVFLVPVASGLQGDTEELRDRYFRQIVRRMEQHTGQDFAQDIVYRKTFSVSDFSHDYNSFRGNAYGLANTLRQTAILKPSCRSRKVRNLYYTGQLTVPGPGVPPSLISGEVVAQEVLKSF
ncbi:MAG TPA: phytoene desaturase family protein [Chitinophagaceae bacterium]|nr:phytoene desaturase family protein [Chitinophagaceae bacterium]